MVWLRRFLVTVGLALLMVIALGNGAARADAGNGATVLHDNPQCFPEGVLTLCFASKGAINDTSTPSGIESDVYNVVQSVKVYDGATLIASDTFTVRFHGLAQDGALQEQSDHECEVITFAGTTYTFSYDSHIANGQIQYQFNGTSC
jgi:hypothetical protein